MWVCLCFNSNYCLFGNYFRWRLVSCRNQPTDFHCNVKLQCEFAFVLIQITVCSEITFDEDLCHVETSQLIFIAMWLFRFYKARDIEENYRIFRGFLNVTFFDHLCFRLIELMSMVFFFYLSCCLITVQKCTKLFRLKDAG